MRHLLGIICICATTLLFAACEKPADNNPVVVETSAALNCNSVAKGYDTSCALILRAPKGTGYNVSVVSEGDWCLLTNNRVNEVSGTMNSTESMLWVKFSQNYGEVRYADITVVFDNGYEFELPLRQTVYDAPENYDKPWNELPKYKADENYIYCTHTSMLMNEIKRNYTFCFDKILHASHWVAYPLHTVYTSGPATRPNVFPFDPDVPSGYQANLSRSYSGPYDRGHQIPAADRKCEQSFMDQTFYSTNMTPQYSNFNQNLWGSLENKVRNQICADTLYVVTGAYFNGPYDSSIEESTTDVGGTIMPIPSHYYKILLRTVSGNTRRSVDSFDDASELKAIGIWLQHKNTGSSTTLPADAFVSVKTIEELTGFEFFNMLNPEIADKVKSQCDPSAWNGLQ